MKSVLVTGGAGAFGSKLAEALSRSFQIIAFDSMVTGENSRINYGPLVKADVRETPRLVRTIKEYTVDHIFHCALVKGDDPSIVYDQHLSSVLSVLQAAREAGSKSVTVFCRHEMTAPMIERILKDTSSATRVRTRLITETGDSAIAQALQGLD